MKSLYGLRIHCHRLSCPCSSQSSLQTGNGQSSSCHTFLLLLARAHEPWCGISNCCILHWPACSLQSKGHHSLSLREQRLISLLWCVGMKAGTHSKTQVTCPHTMLVACNEIPTTHCTENACKLWAKNWRMVFHVVSFPEACCTECFKEYAQALEGEGDEVEDVLVTYRTVERCVHLLTRLRDQIDDGAYLRKARDLKGSLEKNSARRRPHQVAFMLKVLTMSDYLRHASSVKDVLRHSLEMIMPEVLRPAFRALLQESESAVPRSSTISRWRLLLDGAFMLYWRSRNAAQDSAAVRFIMADSSTQHRKIQYTCQIFPEFLLGPIQDCQPQFQNYLCSSLCVRKWLPNCCFQGPKRRFSRVF